VVFRLDLFERILRALAQPEDLTYERQDGMGVIVILVWLGHRLADGRSGVMKELVLQSDCHMRDRLAVGLGQAWPAGIQGRELAFANLVGAVSKLFEQ
jgi:hypothetical protein